MTPYPIIITTKNDHSEKLNKCIWRSYRKARKLHDTDTHRWEIHSGEERPVHAGVPYSFSSDSQLPQDPFLPGLWVTVVSVDSKLGFSYLRFDRGQDDSGGTNQPLIAATRRWAR